jgi:hypothetical protein
MSCARGSCCNRARPDAAGADLKPVKPYRHPGGRDLSEKVLRYPN